MIKLLTISLFLISLKSYSMPVAIQVEIAQEMFDEGEYSKALKKCKTILKKSPNPQCEEIVTKSTNVLSSRKSKKELIAKNKRIAEKNEAKAKKEKREKQLAQRKATKEKKLNSFEYNNQKICECISSMKYFKRKISQEKSNVSGFVNMSKLNKWGKFHTHSSNAQRHYLSMLDKNKFEFSLMKCKESPQDSDAYVRCVNNTPREILY